MTSFAENSITASSSAAVCASAAACMTRGFASEIYIETIMDFTCQRMILTNIIIGNIEILVIINGSSFARGVTASKWFENRLLLLANAFAAANDKELRFQCNRERIRHI